MVLNDEQWAPVPGDWRYQVSSRGRVRSYVRGRPRILAPKRHPSGHVYAYVGGRNRKVHQLVLEAFVGPRPDGAVTRHLNDIPDDNRVENLVWGTPRENVRDAVRNGKHRASPGESSPHSKLTDDDVRNILRSRQTHTALAAKYGVTHGLIGHIRRGRAWKHVERDPEDAMFWARKHASLRVDPNRRGGSW